jgi:Xaa-Pro aminopeptidase
MRATSWISNLRTWPAPRPADDGISLLLDSIRSALQNGKRLGLELGPESRIGFPAGDFLRIVRELPTDAIADGFAILRKVRLVKSAAEIARCRRICEIASDAFTALASQLEIGDTERTACAKLRVELARRGAHSTPYLVCVSGEGGYDCINMGPTDRPLGEGDAMIIDNGSTYDGYFCDFDREYFFGRPSQAVRSAYARVWSATQRGIEATRPGIRMCDLWQAMARELGKEAIEGSNVGRIGHGLGMQLTEPPSINPDDETMIVPGMILTIEPGLGFIHHGANGPEPRVMVHEENVVVTEEGCEVLTRRAPPEPVVVA